MRADGASFLAGVVVGVAFVMVLHGVRGTRATNPYAWMLGRMARARKYEAYPWQTGYVINVSWKGAVRFRSLDGTEGFWLDKSRAKRNLKIIGGRR